jgi:hypothetical protein
MGGYQKKEKENKNKNDISNVYEYTKYDNIKNFFYEYTYLDPESEDFVNIVLNLIDGKRVEEIKIKNDKLLLNIKEKIKTILKLHDSAADIFIDNRINTYVDEIKFEDLIKLKYFENIISKSNKQKLEVFRNY